MTLPDIRFRLAQRAALPSIVRMLADDDLGSQREHYEDPLPPTIPPSNKSKTIRITN